MAKKKDSKLKKVGKFATDELLGIDDMRRVVKYVRKGDFKRAAKSAGAAAFELGTTATAVGKAPAVVAKLAAKSVKKEASKTAAKAADRVARKVAEKTPAPKYGKKGGEVKTVRTDPKDEITIRRDLKQPSRLGDVKMQDENAKKVAVSKPKSATYTTRENTPKQRAAVERRMAKDRANKISSAQSSAYSAVKGTIGKSLAESKSKNLARGVIAGKALKNNSDSKKNKKK